MRRLLVGLLLIVQTLVLAGVFVASTVEMFTRSKPMEARSNRASSRSGGRGDGNDELE